MSNETRCKSNNINNKINHQESRLEKNRTSTVQFQNWDIYKHFKTILQQNSSLKKSNEKEREPLKESFRIN